MEISCINFFVSGGISGGVERLLLISWAVFICLILLGFFVSF